MYIKVITSQEYMGADVPPKEAVHIEINGGTEDSEVVIANTYLKLRGILKAGLKEES